jgi:hypothetical protein
VKGKMEGQTREQLCDCISVFEEKNQGQDVAWWLRNFVLESWLLMEVQSRGSVDENLTGCSRHVAEAGRI